MWTPTSSRGNSPKPVTKELDDQDWLGDGMVYCSPSSRTKNLSSGKATPTESEPGTASLVPSVAQKANVLSEIQNSELNALKLSENLRRAVEDLKKAEDAKRQELRHLRSLHWSISPLRRMPDEILGEIFEVYVLELGGSPWIMTQVSASFRRAAFSTRRIWARLNLDTRNILDNRFSHGRENCLILSHLKSALERSGKALLDIRVEHCTPDLAEALNAECFRWSLFKLTKTGTKFHDDAMSALFKRPTLSGQIKSVTVRIVQNYKAIPEWLDKAQPASLELTQCDLSKFCRMNWWTTLRELRIKEQPNGMDPTDNTPALSLRDILKRTGSYLTYLHIQAIPMGAVVPTQPVIFPELRELKLIGFDHWWLYRGNKVEKLTLDPFHLTPEDVSATYPSLLQLDYAAGVEPLRPQWIIAPNLDLLTLHATHEATADKPLPWLNKDGTLSPMATKRLRLTHISIHHKQILDALRLHKKLEELTITNCRLSIALLTAFGAKPTRKFPIVCPNLRELSIKIPIFPRNTTAARHEDIFAEIVKNRKAQGHPLQKLLVTWPSHGETQDREPDDFVKLEDTV